MVWLEAASWVSGLELALFDKANKKLASTTTEFGVYTFDGVLPGTYKVRPEKEQAGYFWDSNSKESVFEITWDSDKRTPKGALRIAGLSVTGQL